MATITGTSIEVKKILPKGKVTNYSEADFHLEIRSPDRKVLWLEDAEVSFTIINSTDTTDGSVSVTPTGLNSDGLYRISMYHGTTGTAYDKFGTASVKKISLDTVAII